MLTSNLSISSSSSHNEANLCIMPSSHSHRMQANHWNTTNSSSNGEVSSHHNLVTGGKSLLTAESIRQSNKKRARKYRGRLLHLQRDPYIDAVRVRGRINNKRGVRVKAAASPVSRASASNSLQVKLDQRPADVSYYAKTVHVEESKVDNDEWAHSSGDSDSDDEGVDEHDSDYDDGKENTKAHVRVQLKKRRKKMKRRKKGTYVKLGEPKRNKGRKVVYISVIKNENNKYGDKYAKLKGGDYHYDHNYKTKHNYDHGPVKAYHHDRGKSNPMNLMGKGMTRLAGVLGFTLLCVNYMLILKQPTYDKFSGLYYTKYTPHSDGGGGGGGDTVELKSGGPLLLAHCSEIPRETSDGLTLGGQLATASPMTIQPDGQASSMSINQTTGNKYPQVHSTNAKSDIVAAEQHQQRESRIPLSPADRLELFGAPNYFYTTGSPADDRPPTRQRDAYDRGLLAPLQVALNRLLAASRPTSGNFNSIDVDSERGMQLANDMQLIDLLRATRTLAQGGGSARLFDDDNDAFRAVGPGSIGRGGQTELAASPRPQLIQTLNNLIQMRMRPVGIGIRIVGGPRAGIGFRPQLVTLTNNPARTGRGQEADDGDGETEGDAINNSSRGAIEQRDTEDQAQNDQPVADIPEFAFNGDTVELTCNHRLTNNQLYAVKWFKDSLEFYRFVPADRPRARTSFQMPNIDLDLARSGSQSVVLRNVSHLSSGLYSCEAVSEAPNFELMKGERSMRVYRLPETGPRLVVVDRNQAAMASVGVILPSRPLSQGEREEDNWPPRRQTLLGNASPRSQRQMIDGLMEANAREPVIRCSSARSNPVSQLRFFINNRPVELTRTVENSTLRYSDGLESSVVAIRLQLTDFLSTATDQPANNRNGPPLDRAASLKVRPDGTGGSQGSALNKTGSVGKTTTTTSTTKRPKLSTPTGSKKSKETNNRSNAKKDNGNIDHPNAGVRFDDTETGEKADKSRRKDATKKSGAKVRGRAGAAKHHNKITRPGPDKQVQSRDSLERNGDEHSADDEEDTEEQGESMLIHTRAGHSFVSNVSEPYHEAKTFKLHHEHRLSGLISRTANNKSEGWSDGVEKDNFRPSPGTDLSKSDLHRSEQRMPPEIQQRTFSNFIRIKCSSLVSSLDYEMISELNVPLSLVVPTSQLNEALRQQSGSTKANEADANGRRNNDNNTRNDDLGQHDQTTSPTNGAAIHHAQGADSLERLGQASGRPISIRKLHIHSFKVNELTNSANSRIGMRDISTVASIWIVSLGLLTITHKIG